MLLQFLLPPLATRGFDFARWGDIIAHTLGHSLFFSCKPAFPVFQLAAMVFIGLLIALRSRVRTAFSLYVGLSYVLFAILQNVAITPKYGVSLVTINIVMFGLVAATWFWEAVVGLNDFSRGSPSLWAYLAVPAAVLAFWMPVDWATGQPDFDPAYFLTSGSALAFCFMTPVYVCVLLFFYPRVNMLVLRVTGAVGVLIGLYNVVPKLLVRAYSTWWDGALHLPLLILSLVAVILSTRKARDEGSEGPLDTG
ncbi:MAG: hypothetical protein ACYTFZ_06055 [Planctomycetota bacterium]